MDNTDPEPASTAADGPEPAGDAAVWAVGVGPGDPAMVTEQAETELARADVVVGFETVLDVVRDGLDAALLTCHYDDQTAVLERFAYRVDGGERGVAALMGDPSVSGYQFLGRVERAVDGPVAVLPGISSIQVAAARARTPLEHSTVVSLHRRGDLGGALDRLVAAARTDHLLCLPRPHDWMPPAIAEHLLSAGLSGDRQALVYERLTHDDEAVTRTTLGGLAAPEDSFSDLSVLVVRHGDPTPVTERNTEVDT